VVSTPLKNMKVSWDDNPIYYGKIIQMFLTTNQIKIESKFLKPKKNRKKQGTKSVLFPKARIAWKYRK